MKNVGPVGKLVAFAGKVVVLVQIQKLAAMIGKHVVQFGKRVALIGKDVVRVGKLVALIVKKCCTKW